MSNPAEECVFPVILDSFQTYIKYAHSISQFSIKYERIFAFNSMTHLILGIAHYTCNLVRNRLQFNHQLGKGCVSQMAMTVKKNDKEVQIQWRVADIRIPNDEIKNVTEDQDIHAFPCDSEKEVSRIGSTFGKTNRVIIDTDDHQYIIYTLNDKKVYNEITK